MYFVLATGRRGADSARCFSRLCARRNIEQEALNSLVALLHKNRTLSANYAARLVVAVHEIMRLGETDSHERMPAKFLGRNVHKTCDLIRAHTCFACVRRRLG